MKWLLWIPLLTLAALVGCGKREVTKLKAAPDPQVPAGWSVHRVDAANFGLAAPDNWQVPRDPGMDVNTLQNLSNPAVSYGLAPGKESTTAEAVLFLADKNVRPIPGEPMTSISVTRRLESGGANVTDEADDVAREYTKIHERNSIELPVGKAVEIKAVTGTRGGDTIRHIDYVLVNGEEVFVIRFVTTQSASTLTDVARPVMETFRVFKPAP